MDEKKEFMFFKIVLFLKFFISKLIMFVLILLMQIIISIY